MFYQDEVPSTYFSFRHLWGWYCGSISNILLSGFKGPFMIVVRINYYTKGKEVAFSPHWVLSYLRLSFIKALCLLPVPPPAAFSVSVSFTILWIHGLRLEFAGHYHISV